MNISKTNLVIIVIAIIVGFASYRITKHPDGVVEQAAEAVLKTEGIDIDLSASDKCKGIDYAKH